MSFNCYIHLNRRSRVLPYFYFQFSLVKVATRIFASTKSLIWLRQKATNSQPETPRIFFFAVFRVFARFCLEFEYLLPPPVKLQLSSTKYKLSSTKYKLSSAKYKLSSAKYKLSSAKYKLSSTKYKMSSARYKMSSTRNKMSSAKNKMSSIKT